MKTRFPFLLAACLLAMALALAGAALAQAERTAASSTADGLPLSASGPLAPVRPNPSVTTSEAPARSAPYPARPGALRADAVLSRAPGASFGDAQERLPAAHHPISTAESAPNVGINKWTPGGFARPGGVYAYGVDYYNNGANTAEDVQIVDTLPDGTTYLGDTSGLPVTLNPGGTLTWDVGDLPAPSGDHFFWVTVLLAPAHPTGPGALDENCVAISTSTPGDLDPNDDQSCSGPTDVAEGDVDVSVDKWPSPGDPAPGQTFDYEIRVCNNRSSAAGPVALTDTLPAYTTLVDWWVRNNWQPWWNEISRAGGQLLLAAPGLPGDRCSEIVMRLLLDESAPFNTNLINTIEISTPGDVDPANDLRVNSDAWVSGPRPDANTQKYFSNGALVPGGWAGYHVNFWNTGNLQVQAWITDTLPAGTSYQAGSAFFDDGTPFEPAIITAEYLVWSLGDLPVDDGAAFNFTLNLDPALTPGTVIENCAHIGGDFPALTPWDDTSCVSETVNNHGPNLRVFKQHFWNGEGQLGYELRFENVGDEPVDNVWVTDTLPDWTAWDGYWDMGFDWNRLIDQDLQDHQLRWKFSTLYPGDLGWLYFNANLDSPGAPLTWYYNLAEIDTPPGDANPADNTYTDEAFSGGEIQRVEFWGIGAGHAGLNGQALPNATVLVDAPDGQFSTTSDDFGWWNIEDIGPLNPGDEVTVSVVAPLLPVNITIPDPFSAEIDTAAMKVWGQVGGSSDESLQVHGYWPGGYREVHTAPDGSWLAEYPSIPRGANGHIRYERVIDYATVVFHRSFQANDLVLRANYSHDWVEGFFEPGHTIWLTLTQPDGVTVIATAELHSQVIPEWGGQSGWATWKEGWQGPGPDLLPGEWVFAESDDGQTAQLQIGEIDGLLDVEADTVSGTIAIPWFDDPLQGRCEVWVNNGPPPIEFSFDPQGGSYSCDFSTVGWDVTPGQQVAVLYLEPDADQIIRMFEAAAPHLRINTWADGNPGAGGNFALNLSYQNDGGLLAENVVITSTLSGLSYIADTSGFPHTTGLTPGGDPFVRWELGAVAEYSYHEFTLFTHVEVPAGETVIHHTRLTTTSPFDQGDPWEKEAEWSGDVQPLDADLGLNKYPWTGDPAPGTDFVWVVNTCNQGSTHSTNLTLTDTLPQYTSLNGWWAQHPGWELVTATDEELVLSRPTLPSGWCSEVYLDLHLDETVQVGTGISNTATVASFGDPNPGNDTAESWVTVSNPYTNLGVDLWWNWGLLTPGGELRYNVNVYNNGNLPVEDPISLTSTFPGGVVTFREAIPFGGGDPIPPVDIGPDYVTFALDPLRNGFSHGFELVFDVALDATPGTVVITTAEIEPPPGDNNPYDNAASWTETLFGHGPNLRVRKEANWHGFGEGHNAWYNLIIENVGDQAITYPTVTDHYPAEMIQDGDPWLDWGLIDDYTRNDAEHWFSLTFNEIWPGFRHDVGFNVAIPGADPLPFGLTFTNTVDITLDPADTNPADNIAAAVLKTGPDLYVEKTLIGGSLLPGGEAVFALRFGNDQPGHAWWWGTQGNVIIEDTLPPGFEYLSATIQFCGEAEPCPFDPVIDGDTLTWNAGPMGASWWNVIELTARVPADADGRDVFTNLAQVASDHPQDIEADYANNTSSASFAVPLPYFSVSKGYSGVPIAGMPVTYLLALTNDGSQQGTGIHLVDPLPAGLTYGGGGSFSGGVVSWDIANLYAGASSVQTFWGTLACTAGAAVVNQDYRVQASDQGISGPSGAPLSLTIAAPTISASAAASAYALDPGQVVTFTASGETDGTALTYTWDFGDGGTAAGASVTHAFWTPGEHLVTLTATDGCGYEASATVTVTVTSMNVYLPMVMR